MATNSTLKAISGLLKARDSELQIAAIRVLGAIQTSDPAIIKMLGELLVSSGNPNVRRSVLSAFEANPQDLALKYLVQNIEKDETMLEPTLEVIARIGAKAVPLLRQTMPRLSPAVRRQLVGAFPKIRSAGAHEAFVECCFHEDHEMVRNAVHALRAEMPNYNTREQGDLRDKLLAALGNTKNKDNQTSLSSVIISLGIIGQVQVKTKLLPFLAKGQSTQIRRHTLMSLARFEYVGTRHQDVFDAVLPILAEPDWEELVRHAVLVLARIRPRRADNNKLRALLDNPHVGVRVFAIQALAQLDSVTNTESLLALLQSPEMRLREAAAEGLRSMPSAVPVILKHLDDVREPKKAFEMVKILEAHGNRIRPERAREMLERMLKLYAVGDEHYQLYRTALRHLRGDIFQQDICALAAKHREKGEWEKVRDLLKLLDHTELLTPDIRFQLATAKLKTSKRDLARSFRQADYCLEHISILLKDDPKGFRTRFLSEPAFAPEDLFYVGFHFCEQQNEERRFGIEVLQYVVAKFPRKEPATLAKNKLKVEGH